jgi:hypothetical protein
MPFEKAIDLVEDLETQHTLQLGLVRMSASPARPLASGSEIRFVGLWNRMEILIEVIVTFSAQTVSAIATGFLRQAAISLAVTQPGSIRGIRENNRVEAPVAHPPPFALPCVIVKDRAWLPLLPRRGTITQPDRDLFPPQRQGLGRGLPAIYPGRHSFLRRSAARNKFGVFVESSGQFCGLMLEKAVHCLGILHYGCA